jgi:hypothetical protein
VADALGVPYDTVTMDNSNTDSSAVCTGTFASRGTFIGGNAVRFAAEKTRERILDIASKELEISPDDLEIADGVISAKGAPDREISVGDVAGAATYSYGELISGQGTALKPLAEVNDDDGSVTIEPHSAISYAACVIDVEVDDETGETTVLKMLQVYDVGPGDQPDAGRGPDRGRRDDGPRARAARELLSVLSLRGAPRRAVRLLPGAVARGLPEIENVILENPSADGPFGAKAIGEMANNAQPPAIAAAIHDAVGVWITEMPATPERILRALEERREPRREGKRVIYDEPISVESLSSDGGPGVLGRACLRRARRSAPGTASRRSSSSTACACTPSAATRSCSAGCVRARQAGPAPRPRAHGAAHVRRRGLRDDDHRRRDRELGPGDVVCVNRGSSTSCTPRAA